MKIVYVIDSLASKGGAERILCDKMSYMAEQYGYDVHVVTCYQNTAMSPNAYRLSDKVRQTNLAIPYYSQYRYGYPRRLWVKWTLYRQLCRQLTEVVQRIDPDILVGLGYFQADVVTGIPCKAKKVIESHEARIFTMSDYGLERSFASRLYMRFYKWRYFRIVERRADVVVTLTKADAREWSKAREVEVIPNFTTIGAAQSQLSDVMQKRVIAVGRLEWQKGFDRLIDAWAMIEGSHQDWRLDIFGSGTLEGELNARIAQKQLNAVTIHPFTPAIADEYAASSIFALSSRFEGFGLVLLEAMQCGVPCVTFDCPFGPSDVVRDGVCGYVVPNDDIEQFAQKLASLMDDEGLRRRFAEAAVERAREFDVNKIMEQWKRLFVSLLSHSRAFTHR